MRWLVLESFTRNQSGLGQESRLSCNSAIARSGNERCKRKADADKTAKSQYSFGLNLGSSEAKPGLGPPKVSNSHLKGFQKVHYDHFN